MTESDTQANNTQQPRTAVALDVGHRKWPWAFVTLGLLYGAWLCWLGYIAWVNVQAGNQ